MERIRQVTAGTFNVPAGSLFPALHRLEQEGWIGGEWTLNQDARRVRAYTLTRSGRKRLADEKRQWRRVVHAVEQVLETN
jgi:DNA-binding PadR family transcriptional regulator